MNSLANIDRPVLSGLHKTMTGIAILMLISERHDVISSLDACKRRDY